MHGDRVVGLLLNYRDAERSACCIRSLTAEGVAQVLVWDNSADGGRSASQLGMEFADDQRIRIEVSRENVGFACGVNHGLRRCIECFDPDAVLLINNDAYLRPGAIAALHEAALEHPGVSVISMDIDHAGHPQGPMFYQRWSGLQFKGPVVGAFPYASGCCLWINARRTAFPLLDEGFFMYGEDCELGWRLHQRPGSWFHLPRLLVHHEGSASSGLGTLFYETHMVAAHLLLARKLARSPTEAAFFGCARVPVLLARALRRSFRYQSLRPWHALWQGTRLWWHQLQG